MMGTTDWVITIGEVIEKWFPFLSWEDIMEIATSDNWISRRAQRQVNQAIKEGLL